MIIVETVAALAPHTGQELGVSAWRSLSLEDLRGFGAVSGDAHWTHTDPVRAAAETPFGGVIAQGFLLLSLVTAMSHETYEIRGARRFLNYGVDNLRFTHPVKPGDRLRLRVALLEMQAQPRGGTRLTLRCTMEIEGASRPAFIANWIILAFEETT